MNLEWIKNFPVADLAVEDAPLYLWVTNSCIDEGRIKAKRNQKG